ncbi:carbohydrate ABC transporter permease [Nocardia seriolae]|uniref:Starch degradation products transport system permease protein AmyD n=1 Tax=Nocardia seriolae TaxID=37332 RepID=A0ABC9YVV4_9NOCA|nr:sugar ABC transporter permease [Nocardia seriolae]APA94627.1 putative starch degradation products transport system permease protein AmyD [Nocardia seriolae]OJF83318.1 sugar ABC transporter permease [Nocardia seriolae]PSK29709.1 sugar ABC transporter permease [Nocardia seriolae]QOW32075.1 sugar ABC transporter permease [Nocardia seriolae]QUN19686.1 sugar ABC transporter permease [Nocardia seriolae]
MDRTARHRTTPGRGPAAVGLALLLPSLIGVGGFLLLPIAVVLWLSVHSWNLLGPIEFTGSRNWRSVLTDRQFGHSILVTLALTGIVVPVQTALGFAVAAMLTRRGRGGSVLRVMYALPWMCAPVAVGVVWQWIFAPTGGALNAVLGRRVEWLSSPVLALPAVASVIVWMNVGYVALFFIAGIRAVPGEILDAGALDGATGWRRIRWLILPLLRPTMFFVLVTGVLSVFQTFDAVYALTRGGPDHHTDVVAMRLYSEAFEAAHPGRAAVMAVVVFAVLFVITVVQHRYFRDRTDYEY